MAATAAVGLFGAHLQDNPSTGPLGQLSTVEGAPGTTSTAEGQGANNSPSAPAPGGVGPDPESTFSLGVSP